MSPLANHADYSAFLTRYLTLDTNSKRYAADAMILCWPFNVMTFMLTNFSEFHPLNSIIQLLRDNLAHWFSRRCLNIE